jgi:hypothetical protein
MCQFGDCLYVEKCCRSFVGRRHFQQYHAYPRDTDNKAILAAGCLVPEGLARLARDEWVRTRANPPPFNDNGLPNVAHQANTATDDHDDSEDSDHDEDNVCKLSAARAINFMGMTIFGKLKQLLEGKIDSQVQDIVADAGAVALNRLEAYANDDTGSERSGEDSDNEDLGEVERRLAEAAIDTMIQSITEKLRDCPEKPLLDDIEEIIRGAVEAAKTNIGLAGTEGI